MPSRSYDMGSTDDSDLEAACNDIYLLLYSLTKIITIADRISADHRTATEPSRRGAGHGPTVLPGRAGLRRGGPAGLDRTGARGGPGKLARYAFKHGGHSSTVRRSVPRAGPGRAAAAGTNSASFVQVTESRKFKAPPAARAPARPREPAPAELR